MQRSAIFPIKLPAGESITVVFGYVRFPLGALIEWGETYGAVFSAHLSNDGENFREVGRIAAIRRMLLRENGNTLELFRAVPDGWWEGQEITLRELPTTFGAVNLRAQREQSRAMVELTLTGPAPEQITFRYPGIKQAQVDGRPCEIHDDVISASKLNRLVINF